ncbi:tetratricopeptide repeat protein [Nocardia sp. GCM10030253]|uniref:tetratricopeptide repeat protein n=1 Tax=Nocardia sp. GCM10030253 TaxID=3273404 RepID=UPI003644FAA1
MQRSRAYADFGQWEPAIDDAQAAQTSFDQYENETDNEAKPRLVLGRARLALHETDGAITVLREALELFQLEGVRKGTADTRRLLARAYLATGRPDQAAVEYRAALSYYEDVGGPLAAQVAEALTGLGG